MNFLQPLVLAALPLISIPVVIHLINQWRYQTRPWGAMQFLLAANRMNRGFARLRRWLILAMRVLALAGLIFAVARPLSSGLLGLVGGGKTDTTVVLMDRSPSMQDRGIAGISKIETGRRQLSAALEKLGSEHWVAVDAATAEVQVYEELDGLVDASALTPCSATADIPTMLQASLEYLQANNPGPTEIWICSDLRVADWRPDSGTWALVREGFSELPQSVRFNLVAYPEQVEQNLSLRILEVRREVTSDDKLAQNAVLLSLQISRSQEVSDSLREVPVLIEIEGARTELAVTLRGAQTEIRNQRIPLGRGQERGWGKVTIPADGNNSDNEAYFVFAEEPPRRIVLVSENRAATQALEIAAGITSSGQSNAVVEVIAPDQLDSLLLDGAALLMWQTSLPDETLSTAIEAYVRGGGQVIFFPPTSLINEVPSTTNRFLGVAWDTWQSDQKVMVDGWRGDQDLLSATMSGGGLPVGQLEIGGYATLSSERPLSKLATLTGGRSLLAKLPTDHGGVYFFTASADPSASSLAENGIVLFVAIQRAIEAGQAALGKTTQQVASAKSESTADWRRLAGPDYALSTEYPLHRGVYRSGDRLFAINRPNAEDQQDHLSNEQLDQLFAGLPLARVDDSAGNLEGIVREVWRTFLIIMIIALLVEAALCVPRPAPVQSPVWKFN